MTVREFLWGYPSLLMTLGRNRENGCDVMGGGKGDKLEKNVETLTLIHYVSGGGASDDDDEWGDFGDDDDFGFDVEVKKKKKEKVKEKIKEGKGEEGNCFQITFSQKIQFLVYFFLKEGI